jgi:hypothetical protein
MIQASAVTLAKIANAAANTRFLGSGSAGSGAAYAEQTISAGTGISITPGASGITITNVGAGSVGALVLISEVVTSGSQSNVTFSSIPATWRDLVVRVRGRVTNSSADAFIMMQLNADTAANYDYTFMDQFGPGPGATNYDPGQSMGASSIAIGLLAGATATANRSGGFEAVVFDYVGTTFNKSGTSLSSNTWGTAASSQSVTAIAFDWRSTAAVNSAKIFPNSSGAFVDGTVVSLYGHF